MIHTWACWFITKFRALLSILSDDLGAGAAGPVKGWRGRGGLYGASRGPFRAVFIMSHGHPPANMVIDKRGQMGGVAGRNRAESLDMWRGRRPITSNHDTSIPNGQLPESCRYSKDWSIYLLGISQWRAYVHRGLWGQGYRLDLGLRGSLDEGRTTTRLEGGWVGRRAGVVWVGGRGQGGGQGGWVWGTGWDAFSHVYPSNHPVFVWTLDVTRFSRNPQPSIFF